MKVMETPLLLEQRESPLQWHEAAAIVRAVGDAVAVGRIAGVPHVRELTLDSQGTVNVVPGASGRAGGDAVVNLRQLLSDLLEPGAPTALRSLAESADGRRSLAEFTEALAFFERPSKDRDLRALAVRLQEVQEKLDLETELARVTEKARLDTAPPAKSHRKEAMTFSPILRWTVRGVLVLVGAAAIAALVLLFASVPPTQESPTSTGRLGDVPRGIVAALRAAAAATLGTTSAAVPHSAPAENSQARVGAVTSSGSAISPPRPERPSVEIFRAEQPEVVEVYPSGQSPLWPGAGAPGSGRIYDYGDTDVRPAALLRPRVPTVPVGIPAGQYGLMEVLIAEDGRVEQVRLVATTIERRYYDAMMLAAVKAWVFRPAQRDGQPVRYRLRVPLS